MLIKLVPKTCESWMSTDRVCWIGHAQKRMVSVIHLDKGFLYNFKYLNAENTSGWLCFYLWAANQKALLLYYPCCFVKHTKLQAQSRFLYCCFVFHGADVCCFRRTRCLAGLKLNLWICYKGIFYFYSSGNAISTNCTRGENNNWHTRVGRAGRVMTMMFVYIGDCTVTRSIFPRYVFIWTVSRNISGQVLKNKKVLKSNLFFSNKNLLQSW